jgi:hypothetical protein
MKRAVVLSSLVALSAVSAQQSMKPLVTESQAINIAIKAWDAKFGREVIVRYLPYRAFLENGKWHVHSVAPVKNGQTRSGRPEAEVQAADGRVTKVALSR